MFAKTKRFNYSPEESRGSPRASPCCQRYLKSFNGSTPNASPCRKSSSKKCPKNDPRLFPRGSVSDASTSSSSPPPYELPKKEIKENEREDEKDSSKGVDEVYITTSISQIEQLLKDAVPDAQSEDLLSNGKKRARFLLEKLERLEETYTNCLKDVQEIEEFWKQHQEIGGGIREEVVEREERMIQSNRQRDALLEFCSGLIQDLCAKLAEAEITRRSRRFSKLLKKIANPFSKLIFVIRNWNNIETVINQYR